MDLEIIQKKITEYALENAIKFNGKAGQGAVIGKLIAFDPEIKNNMKEVSSLINQIISKINSMSLDQQKTELLNLNPEFENQQKEKKKENKEKRSDIPDLKDAEIGKVVTRIAPEPSKYPHLGHAASFLINYMYKKKYQGKCFMRIDDTNPEKESQEFVDAIYQDVIDYLEIDVDETIFASDYNDLFIEMADQLIEKNMAYTCTCKQEMSQNRRDMVECEHRSKTISVVKQEWSDMKKGDNEGMVLRLKIDMKHKNAVMRDPVIFRIVKAPHYRQKNKFKVWPMYDFECAILEGKLKITHVNRSNEFESRIELQDYIRSLFNLPNPIIRQYARYNVTGTTTKGREIRALIESGDYIGWDDPRLITLRALKRRGIVKDSFYELSKVLGMSKTNSNIDFSVIASINRKILDETAKRFFFIENPVMIEIKNSPEKEFNLEMHPDQNLGERNFKVNQKYYVEKKDFDLFKENEIIRLIDNINFKNKEFVSESYDDFKGKGDKIIHFLPEDENQIVKVKILMPDCKYIDGIAEKNIQSLKVGEVIQFQRFGFCRLDEIKEDDTRVFWYSHD